MTFDLEWPLVVIWRSWLKIANIFLMVRDKHVVTMKHLREVDVGLSNSVKNLTPCDLDGIISRSRKWKSGVASKSLLLGPRCLLTKMFNIAHLVKLRHDLWPWTTFRGRLKVRKRAVHPSNSWASCYLLFTSGTDPCKPSTSNGTNSIRIF